LHQQIILIQPYTMIMITIHIYYIAN